ncbi:CHY zinc finger protein [Endozoicomonas sp. 4G]|uniref:CHY zinc finger protein n=1 Tax=Endozoicomonas sp. 4G TaxID=2872754 RepID=UPI002078BA4D|nr:CHY zinc finger protein [Endozoicomonas sp. 4G]
MQFYRLLITFILSLLAMAFVPMCHSLTIIDRHNPDGNKVRIEFNEGTDLQDVSQRRLSLLLPEGFHDRNSGLETGRNGTLPLTGGKLAGDVDFPGVGNGGFFYSPPPPWGGGGGRPSGLFDIDLVILQPVISWLMSIGKHSVSFEEQPSPARLQITRVNADGSASEAVISVGWLDFLDSEQLTDVYFWNALFQRAATSCPATDSLQWQLSCLKQFLEHTALKAADGNGEPSGNAPAPDKEPERENDHNQEQSDESEGQENPPPEESDEGNEEEDNGKDDNGEGAGNSASANTTTQNLQEVANRLIAIIEGYEPLFVAAFKLEGILLELDMPQRLQVLETTGTNAEGHPVTPLEAVLKLPRVFKENYSLRIRNRFIELLIQSTGGNRESLNKPDIWSELQPIIPDDWAMPEAGNNNLSILHKIVWDIVHKASQSDQPPIRAFERKCFTEYFAQLFLTYSNPLQLIRNLLGAISDVAIRCDILTNTESLTLPSRFLEGFIRFHQHPSFNELQDFKNKLIYQAALSALPDSDHSASGSVAPAPANRSNDLIILKPVISSLMPIGKHSVSFEEQPSPEYLQITRVNADGSANEAAIPVSWLDSLNSEQLTDVDFWNIPFQRAATSCPATDKEPEDENDHDQEQSDESQENPPPEESNDGNEEDNRKDDNGEGAEYSPSANATTQNLQEVANRLIAIIEGYDSPFVATFKLEGILLELDMPERLQVLETTGTNADGHPVTPLEAVLKLPLAFKENASLRIRNGFIEALIRVTSGNRESLNKPDIWSELQPIITADQAMSEAGNNNLRILHKIVWDIVHKASQSDQPPIGAFEKKCFTEYFAQLFLTYSNPLQLIRNLLGAISDVAIRCDVLTNTEALTLPSRFLEGFIRFHQHPSFHELQDFKNKLIYQAALPAPPDSDHSASGAVAPDPANDIYLQQGARPKTNRSNNASQRRLQARRTNGDNQTHRAQARSDSQELGLKLDFLRRHSTDASILTHPSYPQTTLPAPDTPELAALPPARTQENTLNAGHSFDDHEAQSLRWLGQALTSFCEFNREAGLRNLAQIKEESERQEAERRRNKDISKQFEEIRLENERLRRDKKELQKSVKSLEVRNKLLTTHLELKNRKLEELQAAQNSRLNEQATPSSNPVEPPPPNDSAGAMSRPDHQETGSDEQANPSGNPVEPPPPNDGAGAMSRPDHQETGSDEQANPSGNPVEPPPPNNVANRLDRQEIMLDMQRARQQNPKPLCGHYQRYCYVSFNCCRTFFPCHRCHNDTNKPCTKEVKAKEAKRIKCSLCDYESEINEGSRTCPNCNNPVCQYYCSICKHFTSHDKEPYHCDKCGICRIHRDKSFHCDVCNVCLDTRLLNNHKCRPDSGHDECGICLEDVFSGCRILPCSHKVHSECYKAMIQNGIRTCPVCRASLCSGASHD